MAAETRERLRADIAAGVDVRRDQVRDCGEWVTVSVYEKVASGENSRRLATSRWLPTDSVVDVELVADDLAERATQEWERRRRAAGSAENP